MDDPGKIEQKQKAIQLMADYETFKTSAVGQDLLSWLQFQSDHIFNEFLKVQTKRTDAVSHEVLQGRAQFISLLNQFIQHRIEQGRNAMKALAENK